MEPTWMEDSKDPRFRQLALRIKIEGPSGLLELAASAMGDEYETFILPGNPWDSIKNLAHKADKEATAAQLSNRARVFLLAFLCDEYKSPDEVVSPLELVEAVDAMYAQLYENLGPYFDLIAIETG